MAGACDGGVCGRRNLLEGVDRMLSLPLRGTAPGETPDPEGQSLAACWRRFPLEGIDFGVQSGQRDQLVCWEVGGMHWCSVEASVATMIGQVKSETLQW